MKTAMLFLLIVGFSTLVEAQSSIVPLRHPVYGWLLRQRVEGRLPMYDYETRPHDRGKVLSHLRTLESSRNGLRPKDRRILEEYLTEFEFSRVQDNHLDGIFLTPDVIGSAKRVFSNNREPALAAFSTADGDIEGAANIQTGFGQISYSTRGGPFSAFTAQYGASAYMYSRSSNLGMYFEAEDIAIVGDKQALSLDPRWAYSFEYISPEFYNFAERSYRYEGVVSWRSRFMDVDFGQADLTLGSSILEPMLLSQDAPDFTSLRLRLGSSKVYVTAIHGSLYATPSFQKRIYGSDTLDVRAAPNRWITMHRLTLVPHSSFRLSLFETAVYSFRGLDMYYLNPLAPYIFMEQDLGDRDNKAAGMDIQWRPRAGSEVIASVFIDDLASLPSIVNWNSVKVGYDFGYRQAVLNGWMLGAGYTRLGSFLYSHWTRLNAFEHRGQTLGPSIGANSEMVNVRLDGELPRRSRIHLRYQYGKKGLNHSPDGGGDITDQVVIIGVPLYSGTDQQKWHGWEVDLRSQPLRGFEFAAQWKARRMVKGDRLGNEDWLRLTFIFGI